MKVSMLMFFILNYLLIDWILSTSCHSWVCLFFFSFKKSVTSLELIFTMGMLIVPPCRTAVDIKQVSAGKVLRAVWFVVSAVVIPDNSTFWRYLCIRISGRLCFKQLERGYSNSDTVAVWVPQEADSEMTFS